MAISVPDAVGGPVPAIETAVVIQESGRLADPGKYRNPVFYGEKTAAGTATAGVLQGPLDLSDIQTQCGIRSPIHLMAAKFANYRNDDSGRPKADMYIMPIVEVAGGVAATNRLVFVGAATGNGTWIFKVGGHQVRVNVRTGDSITAQGDAFVAAYTALPFAQQSPLLPVNAAGTVTLTATVKGEHPNSIGTTTLQTPDLTTTATWDDATMGGASAPSVAGEGVQNAAAQATALAALLGSGDFANYVVPWRDIDPAGDTGAIDEILEHIIIKADATNMRSSFLIFGDNQTVSTAVTNAGYLDTQDSSRVMHNQLEGTESWHGELAAHAAATIASELHPARSLNGLRSNGLDAPSTSDRYTAGDLKTLLEGGVTPWLVHEGETQVGIVRSIMNRENFGVVDFQRMRIADMVRDDINAAMVANLGRASIVEDGKVVPNVEFVTTPEAVKALIRSRLKLAEEAGWITDVDDLFEQFVSELDLSAGELRQAFPIQMVAQLHNIMTRIDVKV